MPCALPTSIMSTEYAQEGNQRGSSVSTSGDDLSDDQTKINSNPSTPATSSRASPPVRQEMSSDSMATSTRPHHSFSIDALVGNVKSSEPAKAALRTTEAESNIAEPWASHHLIDLKRIQAYYQQLYSQNFPLKQLNNYLYPHLNGVPENGATKLGDVRQQDQLLTYYANLYLQSSSFYQERYLESLKAFSNDSPLIQNNSKDTFSSEALHPFENPSGEGAGSEESSAPRASIPKKNVNKDSSHASPNDSAQTDCYYGLTHHSGESFFRNSMLTKDASSRSPGAQLQLPPSSLYSQVEKPVDLAGGLRSGYSQHLFGAQSVPTSLNDSNFYPPYCDYDLLAKSKSTLMLTGSSPNATTPNSLHSPLAPGADSNGPSPGSGGSGGGSLPAASTAYHLSSMFRKPKRIRTAFSPGQLLRLEEIFEKNRYVVGCERKQLARDLNLSETQIKVWFQNRRTKHKREKHVGVGPSGGHSLHSSVSYHSENKKASSGSSSSSSSSLPPSSSAGYMSNGSFAMTSSSAMYGSHFKGQNNVHRTLLAK